MAEGQKLFSVSYEDQVLTGDGNKLYYEKISSRHDFNMTGETISC
jgi:hypothetical protein